LRIAALISGSGTTLQNLLDRGIGPIVGVVASKPGIGGIARAERAGLPIVVVDPREKDTFSDRVFAAVRSFGADLVCLCGWLKLLKIPEDFQNRVLNIHPSLLPSFGGPGMYGLKVHQAVLKAGCKISGCTVHIADNTYDTGPILVQKAVPVLDGDTPETLASRVFAAECDAYPEAIEIIQRREFFRLSTIQQPH
jgi:phosphoribosylglycinamide formyltransferase-1